MRHKRPAHTNQWDPIERTFIFGIGPCKVWSEKFRSVEFPLKLELAESDETYNFCLRVQISGFSWWNKFILINKNKQDIDVKYKISLAKSDGVPCQNLQQINSSGHAYQFGSQKLVTDTEPAGMFGVIPSGLATDKLPNGYLIIICDIAVILSEDYELDGGSNKELKEQFSFYEVHRWLCIIIYAYFKIC